MERRSISIVSSEMVVARGIASIVPGAMVVERRSISIVSSEMVIERRKSTAHDLGKPGYDTTYGFGIPQADAAVAAAP